MSPLSRLGRCLTATLLAELPLVVLLEIVGVPFSGAGFGELLWNLHLPGILVLERFRLCCGYDHFVISDAWVIGEVQHPNIPGLISLALANAVLVGLLVSLAWMIYLAVSGGSARSNAAA